MPKVSLTVAVEVTVASKLAEEAKRRGLKLSRVVNEALAEWVSQSKPKSGRVVTVKRGDNDDRSARQR